MSINIGFNSINVNGQNRNGAVSIGETIQSGWSAHAKQNIGQGVFFGINNTFGFVSNIVDPDAIDAPIMDNDVPASAQGQSL